MNQNSRTVNASKNAISAFSNKIVMFLLTFICRKFFIKYIGVEYLGISSLFSNVLTLLSLADLGLGTAMNVSLYKPIAENDTLKLAALLNFYRRLYRYIAAAVMIIGLSLLPFLKYIVNMDRNIPFLKGYYVIFVLKNAISYLFVYRSSIIRADQKTYLVNRIDIYVNILRAILQIISLVIFRNYLVYILIDVARVIAHNIIVSIIAGKSYPFINDRKAELTPDEKKGIFQEVSSVFLYKVSSTLINGTDNILISVLIGTVYVGLYANYLTITQNITSYVALLFSSLTAGIGNLIVTSSPEKRYSAFKTLEMVSYWLSCLIVVCLFFLTQDFIELWFGKEMLLDNMTLIAIVIDTFFSNCMRPIWAYREGTGMYRQIKYIMCVTAAVNLFLSIVLGKLIGISGIIFATSISKFSTYFLYEPNVLYRDFFHRRVGEYYKSFADNVLLMLVCLVVAYIPTQFIKRVTIANWFIKGIICFTIVNVILYFKYRQTTEFADVKNRILNIIAKGRRKYKVN